MGKKLTARWLLVSAHFLHRIVDSVDKGMKENAVVSLTESSESSPKHPPSLVSRAGCRYHRGRLTSSESRQRQAAADRGPPRGIP